MSPEISDEQFFDLVQKELKNQATDEEIEILTLYKKYWRAQLVNSKKSCENQFVAQRARLFDNHRKMVEKKISREDYFNTLSQEQAWKCNAVRFLQQIESRLKKLSTEDE